METLKRFLPSEDWIDRNKAKIGGLLFGTFGTLIITSFFVVAITGEPIDGRNSGGAANVYAPWEPLD